MTTVPYNRKGAFSELEEIYSETPFSPDFKELDISIQSYFSRSGFPTAKRYIGATIVSTPEGDLKGIRLTSGVWAKNLNELHYYCDAGDTLVVFNGGDLDVLVKTLGPTIATNLYEGLSQSTDGLQIHYTPTRLLSLWIGKKSVRVNSLKLWFRQFTLDRARDMMGLPFTMESEEHKVLDLWLTILNSSKSVWPTSNPAIFYGASLVSKPSLDEGLQQVDLMAIPIEAQEMAYNCIHAPWVDAMVRGQIGNVHDYDLNSAYPFEMARLPSIDYVGGKWTESNKYMRSSDYGFTLSVVEIFRNVDISPVRLRFQHRLYSPTGTWVGYITKEEIDFIRRWKIGKVEVLNGWWFKVHRAVKPFRKASMSYISQRAQAKGDGNIPLSYVLKMCAASVYGRFLQKKQTLEGDWITAGSFCPIYACIVMTRVKMKIAEMIMRAGVPVNSITVDGVMTSKPIPQDQLDQVSGGIKLVGTGAATIVAPLIYNMEDRVSSLDLRELIERDPNSTRISLPSIRRVSLCEGLSRNNFELVGKIDEDPYSLLVGAEYGRKWRKRPIVARQLLEERFTSKALPVEEIVYREW